MSCRDICETYKMLQDDSVSFSRRQNDEITKLKEQNSILIEALKFYSEEKHWNSRITLLESRIGTITETSNKIDNSDLSIPRGGKGFYFKVAGKRAREALKKVGVER